MELTGNNGTKFLRDCGRGIGAGGEAAARGWLGWEAEGGADA
jgi:hypothetical protein